MSCEPESRNLVVFPKRIAARRSFIRFVTLATAATFCKNALAAARRSPGGAADLKFSGIGLDPSSIDRIEAPGAEVKAHAENATIGNISGNALIKSKFSRVRGGLVFDTSFAIGVDGDCGRSNDSIVAERLRAIGLSAAQIRTIQDAIFKDLESKSHLTASPDVAISGFVYPGNQAKGKGLSLNQAKGTVEVPIPWDISLPDLKPSFNVNNLVIPSLSLASTTDIRTDPIRMAQVGVDDFQVAIADSDAFSADSANLENFRISSMNVPQVALHNLSFPISIPKLGASQIPIDIESNNGTADAKLDLFTFSREWTPGACFDLWFTSIHVWCKFRLDLAVYIKFQWVFVLLKVTIVIRNAFVNGIKIVVSLPKIVFKKIKIGLLHIKRVLYSH